MEKNEAMAIFYARLVLRGAKKIELVPEKYRELTKQKLKTLEPLEEDEDVIPSDL